MPTKKTETPAEDQEIKQNVPKIISNKSDGHNYKYSSLADLAKAGIDIPPMRIAPLFDPNGNPVFENGKLVEYVEALVNDEWIRASRVVIPTSTRSNEAQNYGSALTYARRYGTLDIFGIACTDDQVLETHSIEEQKANEQTYKDELKDLWEKAGGPDEQFDPWFNSKTENGKKFTSQAYATMKASLLAQINKKAEEKKND